MLGSYGPLAQKEAKAVCKFLLLWKGCSPGSHDFASVSGLAFLVCSLTTVWMLWTAWLYTYVIHLSPTCVHSPACRMMCLMCLNSTQQHWTGRDKKQRQSKKRDQLQQTSASSTCPKKRARGRQEHQPKIPKSNQKGQGRGKDQEI